MNTERTLIELAHEVEVASELREGVLALLCPTFHADIGIFVAREHEREVRTLQGLHGRDQARLEAAWQSVKLDVMPVKERALRAGVATDREVLGARLTRTILYRRIMEPVGGTETLFLVPQLS